MWSGVNPLSTKGGTWKMVKADNERLRFLTREEVRALLGDLEKRHPQLHDMALLSLRTGLRPTEIFKLRGQDVDGNACGLYIIQKGGKRVFVRLPEDMIRMLQAYTRKPAEPIFQQPRKKTARFICTAILRMRTASRIWRTSRMMRNSRLYPMLLTRCWTLQSSMSW